MAGMARNERVRWGKPAHRCQSCRGGPCLESTILTRDMRNRYRRFPPLVFRAPWVWPTLFIEQSSSRRFCEPLSFLVRLAILNAVRPFIREICHTRNKHARISPTARPAIMTAPDVTVIWAERELYEFPIPRWARACGFSIDRGSSLDEQRRLRCSPPGTNRVNLSSSSTIPSPTRIFTPNNLVRCRI